MMLSRFMAAQSRLSLQTPAFLGLACRPVQMYQPASLAMFAKRSKTAAKPAEEEGVEEVEIVGQENRRDSEASFRSWLKKDLKSERKRQVNWN